MSDSKILMKSSMLLAAATVAAIGTGIGDQADAQTFPPNIVGVTGTSGVDGTTSGQAGTAGGDASAFGSSVIPDAAATSGRGGAGATGVTFSSSGTGGGTGGAGGSSGSATATGASGFGTLQGGRAFAISIPVGMVGLVVMAPLL